MKFPILFTCRCGTLADVWFAIDEHSKDWVCPSCGQVSPISFGTNCTRGHKAHRRARHEFSSGDFNMAIVCSAAALEFELDEMAGRWITVDALGKETHDAYEKALKEGQVGWSLQKHALAKLAVATKTAHPGGWKAFLPGSESEKVIQGGFPSLKVESLADDVQRELFDKRNHAIHVGDPTFDSKTAIKCLNISQVMLNFLNEIDDARREELEKEG